VGRRGSEEARPTVPDYFDGRRFGTFVLRRLCSWCVVPPVLFTDDGGMMVGLFFTEISFRRSRVA
jgi:hypothetical protein